MNADRLPSICDRTASVSRNVLGETLLGIRNETPDTFDYSKL
jgi:hypothetical protein